MLEKETINSPKEESARFNILYRDVACRKFTLLAIQHYTDCLVLDTKHVYQALPRLLSLWFDFVSSRSPGDSSYNLKKEKLGECCHHV